MDKGRSQSRERIKSSVDSAREPQWPNLSRVHASVIEDDPDTRAMVSDVLSHCGALVTVHHSADAAIADLGEYVPTIFICDLSMPGLNGLQFMRRMRSLPPERGGSIPSIAVTGYYEDFAAHAALEAGFSAYLTKPVRLEDLCRLVKELTSDSTRGAEFPDLSAYTIIVVDDDEDSLEVLAALLRSSGATVFAARTAVGALVYVDSQAPDVIITDLSMPQMDGLELVQRIRRHPTRHALPAIIALTSFPEQYMDTKGAGFYAFLRKPVNFDELCTTIKRLGRYQRSRYAGRP